MLTRFGLRVAIGHLFGRTILRFTLQFLRMLATSIRLAHLDSPLSPPFSQTRVFESHSVKAEKFFRAQDQNPYYHFIRKDPPIYIKRRTSNPFGTNSRRNRVVYRSAPPGRSRSSPWAGGFSPGGIRRGPFRECFLHKFCTSQGRCAFPLPPRSPIRRRIPGSGIHR
jgi:hypothetical protein